MVNSIYLTDPATHYDQGNIQNLGDLIIKDAIEAQFPEIETYRARWVPITGWHFPKKSAGQATLVLAGANILSNHPYLQPAAWSPHVKDLWRNQYTILLGVGWWQYQANPDFMTKLFYQKILRKNHVLHSVRDSYTALKLRQCGIPNVVNTGCPTMWDLPNTFSFKHKPDNVLFTLTDYNKNPASDLALIRFLEDKYSRIFFFPQGTSDLPYLRSLVSEDTIRNIQFIERDIASYNRILKELDIDYIGTRLHAGIRALQYKRRTFIIGIDNRAREIAKDTGLTVIDRSDIQRLGQMINQEMTVHLAHQKDNVETFKELFRKHIFGADKSLSIRKGK